MPPSIDLTATSADGALTPTVWFVRNYGGFSGGHLVHGRYYQHVAQHSQWQAKIYLTYPAASAKHKSDIDSLWPTLPTAQMVTAHQFLPQKQDVLFLAGMDWEFVHSRPALAESIPRLNLIQGLRHAQPDTPLYDFLSERAIRICVSDAVAEAIQATGRVNGPIIVIPNGVELPPDSMTPDALTVLGPAAPKDSEKSQNKAGLLLVGYKNPQFAQALSVKLSGEGIAHDLITQMLPREDFLNRLDSSATVVCLPLAKEGFYLPPLEAMARGALVITTDCGGSRGFCYPDINCLLAEYTLDSFYQQVQRALHFNPAERESLLKAGFETARQHSIAQEREKFYQVLTEVKQLW